MIWEFTTIINLQEAQRPWKKLPKEKKKMAERRAKKQAKTGSKKQEDETIPLDQVITLDHLTNPDKK